MGERCFAVAAAPDGTLFANVMDAGCQEYVASYDPLTLEERFRLGADRLENVRDLAVFANELFVMDSVHDELYNCFHVPRWRVPARGACRWSAVSVCFLLLQRADVCRRRRQHF